MVREWTRRAAYRPFAWSAVMCAVLCALIARPAAAAPPTPTVPDAGSRPAVTGSFQVPGAGPGSSVPTPALPASITPGPLGTRIMTESAALEMVGQQLLKLEADTNEAKKAAEAARTAWTKATRELSDLRDKAGHEAGEAYKAATALGPLSGYASDLHQLSVLAPQIGQQPGGQATARDVERAEQIERAADTAHQAAKATADALNGQHAQLKADYDRRNAALIALRTQNAAEYQRELAAIDAQQASLGAGLNVGGAVNGSAANPIALKALEYAKSKLGAPYEWGAQGPVRFDCSGLVLWSYQQAGVQSLPRVANDQYNATAASSVKIDQLLPGDLLFFATNKADWRTIHHVAMYYGNGYMIHAPTTGDVVKISPVWWAEYYGATRVAPAVPAPTPGPTTPAPGPTKPTTPGQVPPSSSTSRPPTPGPSSTTPSPSKSPTTSPSPTPSSTTTTTAPSDAASTTASRAPSASTSASAGSSTTSAGSATASPSPSG